MPVRKARRTGPKRGGQFQFAPFGANLLLCGTRFWLSALRVKDSEELKRARALVSEAIAYCDTNGHGLAAIHLQWARDLLGEQLAPTRVREPRREWGDAESPLE